MIISIKDAIKLIGISIVCFCAVYVCTFMLNYYFDASSALNSADEFARPLYEAQLSMAKFTVLITGGALIITAVGMLFFYIKLYIDNHSEMLGILKALGYSNSKIARGFCVFGISAFIGCSLGFGAGWASMDFIYGNMSLDGMEKIPMNFHVELLLFLVVLPSVLFGLASYLYSCFSIKENVIDIIRKAPKIKEKNKFIKNKAFLSLISQQNIKSQRSVVAFVLFSCFCFSAMMQMGLSMENLNSGTMGYMILIIGIVLSLVSITMAMSTLISKNAKTISLMRAFGYDLRDCVISSLKGYVPFALIGFIIGTVYQFGLLKFMVNIIFSDVSEMINYTFDLKAFFITLSLFLLSYGIMMIYYIFKISRISLKKIMTENI